MELIKYENGYIFIIVNAANNIWMISKKKHDNSNDGISKKGTKTTYNDLNNKV